MRISVSSASLLQEAPEQVYPIILLMLSMLVADCYEKLVFYYTILMGGPLRLNLNLEAIIIN